MGNISLMEMLARMTRAIEESPHHIVNLLYNLPEYKELATRKNNSVTAVHSHIQTASSTSCGWGGIAGQAFTDFWITAIEFEIIGVVAVYIGRIAYICKMDDNYRECISSQGLPLWDQCQNGKLAILWKATK